MAEIICIVGLPGSGKTYLAEKEYVTKGYILIDDPIKEPDLDNKFNYVICDPHFCHELTRKVCEKLFKQKGFEVKWFFFENNEEKCRRNIKYRNDGRNIKSLEAFDYIMPDGVETLEIWQNEITSAI